MTAPYAFSRRTLFKSTAAIAAAAALPVWFTEELLGQSAPQAPKSPNDLPAIALVGCGGRGRSIINEAKRFGRIVAVCDVDEDRRTGAAAELGGEAGSDIRPYKDYRELIEKEKDVAAIFNGTPDHWHTLVNMRALKAGKDVYGEKPLTLTIDEGTRLVRTVKETGRVLQTGSQQRSEGRFRLACELVRNGRIGKLERVTTILPAGLREGPFKESTPPKKLDWDLWLGQAPMVPYVKERAHANFRFWYDYSGGTITDWGAHHNDIARWAIGELGPVSVDATRLAEPIPGGYTAVPEYRIEYKYANGVTHTCQTTTADTIYGAEKRKTEPGERRIGVLFEGPKGWIYVTRGKLEASDKALIDEPLPSGAERLYKSDNHMANFFECMRTRKSPAADVEIGHRSASLCHLGSISLRLKRALKWDPAKEAFVGDDEAQGYVAREQRKPWTYETA
jgi:predicted dehydrogenase